jgi:Uma2 family endonuclease
MSPSGSDFVRPAHCRVRLTYDDFVLFPDDGKRHELIDGEHYVTPAPTRSTRRSSGILYFLIRGHLETQPSGRVFMAPFDVVFTDFDVVETDLLYMTRERAADILTPKHVCATPELVVEIGSPSTRKLDETIKRRLYERAGVLEYWFVDPDVDTVRIYRRAGERFARALELAREADDVLTTPLRPGLEMTLAQIFLE